MAPSGCDARVAVWSAKFLLLLVAARAEPGIFAGKGSLNGVALVKPKVPTLNSNLNQDSYFVTSGNGTWVYPEFSCPSAPSGAYSAQGDVTFASALGDFQVAAGSTGTFYPQIIGFTGSTTNPPTPQPFTPSAKQLTLAPPLSSAGEFYSLATAMGLTKVTFPSKGMGVAVGLGSGPDFSFPTILLTPDKAASWMKASGVPKYERYGAVPSYNGTTSPVSFPMPPMGAPDLYDVYFASKSLGWAVGGNAALAAWATGQPIPTDQSSGWPVPDWGYGAGAVLMTTNGGTVWRNIPVTYDQVSLYAAFAQGPTVGNSLYSAWQPSTLLAVSADSAGKNVWAVGCPTWQLSPLPAATDLTNPTILVNLWTDFVVNIATYGTILFSGNGGATWSLQKPPTPSNYNYALADVYVLKSSTVFAVGGSLNNPAGTGYTPTGGKTTYSGAGYGNGVIICTETGGASWYMQSFPGSAYGMAPAFTDIEFNGPVGWVVGFVFDVGPVSDSTGTTKDLADSWWPVTSSSTLTGTYTWPVDGVNVDVDTGAELVMGLSYTVLITMDRKSWTPCPFSALPRGFAAIGDFSDIAGRIPAEVVQQQPDIMGIVWDNAYHGWMYGIGTSNYGTTAPAYTSGFILVTFNGGATWTYEMPDAVVANQMHVYALANVPSSY